MQKLRDATVPELVHQEDPRISHSATAQDAPVARASSSDSSDMLHKGNEDAIKPKTPHEWRSHENPVPAGPFLQYLGQSNGKWLGSAMICLPPAYQNNSEGPVLHMSTGGPSTNLAGRKLDQQDGWTFWRFDLIIQMISAEQAVRYSVSTANTHTAPHIWTFYIPAVQQPIHWGFHSCNGLSADGDLDLWGEPLLWRDVAQRHAESHLHVMVGGGDQIYNDGFWKAKPFVDWLAITSDKERYEHPFTMEMEQTLNSWVLNHYRQHYTHALLREIFASIPQVGQKDDHDIFDGWGSYPEALQTCPVFQGTFTVLNRFFLIFQQHTNLETAYADNDLFGPNLCYSFLRMMGPNQAMLVPDTRGERTRFKVMSQEHYDMMFERCQNLPSTVRHLVIVLTVPMIFPKLPIAQEVLTKIENFHALKRAMAKTGVGAGILDKFGHSSLLDDIEDHWDSTTHLEERKNFLLRLQEYTRSTGQRVSFISGDVHAAQVGRTYTHPKMRHLQHDFRFMPQITSSAIWNNPPPDKLIFLLHKFDKASKLDKQTREKSVKIFKRAHPHSAKVLARRNWCEVEQSPVLPNPLQAVNSVTGPKKAVAVSCVITFTLRVENPDAKNAAPEEFPVPVPPFVPAASYEQRRISFRSKQVFSCFSSKPQVLPEDEF